jgi:hypothetical protein
MNNFYKDSHILFKDISKNIAEDKIVSNMDAIENTLLFALGLEKLLKGLLHDINPILILENTDFKNAFAVLYKSKLIKANENTNDISQKPEDNVIAFHTSVIRAALISQTAYDYKNTLMKIKKARDIIVHNSFDKLDINELKLLLKRDFYPLLKAFSEELCWGELHCFNNQHSKLASISSTLQNDISKKVKLKLEAALSAWNVTKGAAGQNIKRNQKLTVEMLQNEFAYPTECPCCKNKAVVYTKPVMNYNQYIKQEIQVGLDILNLECGFCRLQITDYTELDFLKIKPDIENKDETITLYSEE